MAEHEGIWSEYRPTYWDGWSAVTRRGDLVRCRDCKHASEGHWPAYMEVPDGWLDCTGPLVTVWDYRNDRPANNPVRPDGFCAWGERRELADG